MEKTTSNLSDVIAGRVSSSAPVVTSAEARSGRGSTQRVNRCGIDLDGGELPIAALMQAEQVRAGVAADLENTRAFVDLRPPE